MFEKLKDFILQIGNQQWMKDCEKLYHDINNLLLSNIDKQTKIYHQIQLGPRKGGMGLKNPKEMRIASRLVAKLKVDLHDIDGFMTYKHMHSDCTQLLANEIEKRNDKIHKLHQTPTIISTKLRHRRIQHNNHLSAMLAISGNDPRQDQHCDQYMHDGDEDRGGGDKQELDDDGDEELKDEDDDVVVVEMEKEKGTKGSIADHIRCENKNFNQSQQLNEADNQTEIRLRSIQKHNGLLQDIVQLDEINSADDLGIDIFSNLEELQRLHAQMEQIRERARPKIERLNNLVGIAHAVSMRETDRLQKEILQFAPKDTIISFEPKKTSHAFLSNVIQSFHEREFIKHADVSDVARLKALQCPSAMDWLQIPANPYYGRVFSNKHMMIGMALILGAPMMASNQTLTCRRCGAQNIDPYGHHAIICPNGDYRIARHNNIQKIIGEFAKQAQHSVEYECKFTNPQTINHQLTIQDQAIVANASNDKERIRMTQSILARYDKWAGGRPGDIKINDFKWNKKGIQQILYMDVCINSAMANSYVAKAAEDKFSYLEAADKAKRKKYDDPPNFVPVPINIFGMLFGEGKKAIQSIAARRATRKNISYDQSINHIRSKINGSLMADNIEMIIQGYYW